QNLAHDERNSLIFVSYQIEGTLGRRIQKGAREVSIMDQNGRIRVIKINLKVHTVEGFSGHSDRRQIINYLRRISQKPENIIVCHGERSKCLSLAEFLRRRYKVNAIAPDILETIKLR
ncbi:MAG TPA: beta-CASP ribonuclease aCPSF1, partial [Candidatus Bathyarchaeota archaeon]|nr:beta-CASP ribonuclease aCPSF1 [Candidatus Bathyarchaeota archaeon]